MSIKSRSYPYVEAFEIGKPIVDNPIDAPTALFCDFAAYSVQIKFKDDKGEDCIETFIVHIEMCLSYVSDIDQPIDIFINPNIQATIYRTYSEEEQAQVRAVASQIMSDTIIPFFRSSHSALIHSQVTSALNLWDKREYSIFVDDRFYKIHINDEEFIAEKES